jgi:hypothetical protein
VLLILIFGNLAGPLSPYRPHYLSCKALNEQVLWC